MSIINSNNNKQKQNSFVRKQNDNDIVNIAFRLIVVLLLFNKL